MAKITRTPYNASRWITKRVSSNTTLDKRLTGQCIFVTAPSEINLNINFLDAGSYFKIILREDSVAAINIDLPAMEGVLIYDNGSVGLTNAGATGQTRLTIPATASAGTYIDLICDGAKWYVTGMAHNVEWTQS